MENELEQRIKSTLEHFRVDVHSVRSDLQAALQESSGHQTDIGDLKFRVDRLEEQIPQFLDRDFWEEAATKDISDLNEGLNRLEKLNIDERFISLALQVRELQEKVSKFILGDSREAPELRVGYDEVSDTYAIGPMEYFVSAVEGLSVGSVFKIVMVQADHPDETYLVRRVD